MDDSNRSAAAVSAISVDELRLHIERNDVFILDLRRSVHGAQVYGAIRYDPKKLREAEKLILPLPKSDGLIALYDEDGSSKALAELATRLAENGYGSLHILEGGYRAWEAAGGRTEEATLEQPVPLVS